MNYLNNLTKNYKSLHSIKEEIKIAVDLIIDCFNKGCKIITCGNGGSAADAEHIVGELMKGFRLRRNLSYDKIEQLKEIFPDNYKEFSQNLQQAIPAVSLVAGISLPTAFANDLNPEYVFAQQVYGLGKEDDILIAISTSGNSKNVFLAAQVAKIRKMKLISLTGNKKNILEDISDVTIKAPSEDTAEIQEFHLPIYHCICSIVEDELFG